MLVSLLIFIFLCWGTYKLVAVPRKLRNRGIYLSEPFVITKARLSNNVANTKYKHRNYRMKRKCNGSNSRTPSILKSSPKVLKKFSLNLLPFFILVLVIGVFYSKDLIGFGMLVMSVLIVAGVSLLVLNWRAMKFDTELEGSWFNDEWESLNSSDFHIPEDWFKS